MSDRAYPTCPAPGQRCPACGATDSVELIGAGAGPGDRTYLCKGCDDVYDPALPTGPIGNVICDVFFAELDRRIDGTSKVEMPPEDRVSLASRRPGWLAAAHRDPDGFAARLRGLLS